MRPTHLRAFLAADAKRRPAPSSQARATAALKSFFRFLVDDERLERDPARPLRTPKKRETLPDVLTMAELERLLAAPARGDIWERHFAGRDHVVGRSSASPRPAPAAGGRWQTAHAASYLGQMRGRVRVARLFVCVGIVCATVGAARAGLGTASSGRQQAEWVQVVIVVPARLDNEAAWMHRAIQPLDAAGRPKPDYMTVKGKRVSILWNNAGVGTSTTDEMLRYAAQPFGGPYGRNALLVDRKLTSAERRLFTVVPLWTDADVLLVAPDSDLCTTGLALRRVRMLLSGKARGLRLTVPVNRNGTARSSFDVTPATSIRFAQESSLVASAVGAGEAAVVGFQLARPSIEAGTACAAPIDGVAPTVKTVRSGRYPVSRPVGFAFNKAVYRSKQVGAYGHAIRARFLEHAKGALGQAFVANTFGRGALPGW